MTTEDHLKDVWKAFRLKNPNWKAVLPGPPVPSKRNVWVSRALFSALNDACMEVSRWAEESVEAEVAGRLQLWPDSGGWSLAERIIFAETVWMDDPMPEHGGGKGSLQSRLDHWLTLADERFDLHNEGAVKAVKALGVIEIHVDCDGSFEPYTLRLPEEKHVRNPSRWVLGMKVD